MHIKMLQFIRTSGVSVVKREKVTLLEIKCRGLRGNDQKAEDEHNMQTCAAAEVEMNNKQAEALRRS